MTSNTSYSTGTIEYAEERWFGLLDQACGNSDASRVESLLLERRNQKGANNAGANASAHATIDFWNDRQERPQELSRSYLFCACDKGNTELVKVLLDHGAHPGLQDSRGWSALHQATRRGQVGAVEAIMAKIENNNNRRSADENDILWGWSRRDDRRWKSPLQLAIQTGHLDITKLLIVPRIVQLRR